MKKLDYLDKLFNLKNKVIILTGSSGFLGTQFANSLSQSGAHVVLVDIETDKNKKLEKTIISKYHTKPTAYHIDITDLNSVKKLIKSVFKKYGQIDGLVNNAAFHPKTKTKNISVAFEDFPTSLWNDAISINLTGMFYLSQQVGKIMKKQGKGSIVNISSIYGLSGPDQRIYGKSQLNSPVAYAVTKGGVINFTRYLAAYWNNKNIRVNTLSLGGVEAKKYMDKNFIKNYSNKTILGRMAQNSEYNGSLLFLLSDASSYMTGSNLVVDGGWTAW
jgi:NAD(P)-dependent dehydrogenase (short-subunit alcohol dehydrogenase family)